MTTVAILMCPRLSTFGGKPSHPYDLVPCEQCGEDGLTRPGGLVKLMRQARDDGADELVVLCDICAAGPVARELAAGKAVEMHGKDSDVGTAKEWLAGIVAKRVVQSREDRLRSN